MVKFSILLFLFLSPGPWSVNGFIWYNGMIHDEWGHTGLLNWVRKFWRRFLRNSVQNWYFLYGELPIILKICKHSNFFNYWTNICLIRMFKWNFGFLLILVWNVGRNVGLTLAYVLHFFKARSAAASCRNVPWYKVSGNSNLESCFQNFASSSG